MSSDGKSASVMVDVEIDGEHVVSEAYTLTSSDVRFAVADALRRIAARLDAD